MIGPGPVAPTIKLSITLFSMTSGYDREMSFSAPAAPIAQEVR